MEMYQDCGRFMKQCNRQRGGWFGAKCTGWVGGKSTKCQQCYQQALSLERQCQEQKFEDGRFDNQQSILITQFREIGKWVGIGALTIVVLVVFFRA